MAAELPLWFSSVGLRQDRTWIWDHMIYKPGDCHVCQQMPSFHSGIQIQYNRYMGICMIYLALVCDSQAGVLSSSPTISVMFLKW